MSLNSLLVLMARGLCFQKILKLNCNLYIISTYLSRDFTFSSLSDGVGFSQVL